MEHRRGGTGVWFESRSEFTQWKYTPNSLLWLSGNSGCGKSVLAASIIEHVKAHCRRKSETAVAYFYFDFADMEKQKCGNMVRSLITQLCPPNGEVPQALMWLYSSCAYGKTQPNSESLLSLLCKMIQQYQEVFIILDALDECGEGEKLLQVIENIAGWELDGLHILLTSRKEYHIEKWMKTICKEHNRIRVQGEEVKKDISTYVSSEIRTNRNLKQWEKYPRLHEEIEERVTENAHEM